MTSVGTGRRPSRRRSGRGPVDFRRQGAEVDVPIQKLQHDPRLIELGFAFFGGKQALFDHGGSVERIRPRLSHLGGFSRCPV
jgi:hypothetical protein